MIAPQRRGRSIAMSPEERAAFLRRERVCRVATIGPHGEPHVAPLWFVWHEDALWLYSLVLSQRWADLERDPRVSVVVDAGETYDELIGCQLSGHAEPVGPVPRLAGPAHPELDAVEAIFAAKYGAGDDFTADGKHAWLRIAPRKFVSWRFANR